MKGCMESPRFRWRGAAQRRQRLSECAFCGLGPARGYLRCELLVRE
jgi:hypothetical protein